MPADASIRARGETLARQVATAETLCRQHPGGPTGSFYRLVRDGRARALRRHMQKHGRVYIRDGMKLYRIDPAPGPAVVRASLVAWLGRITG